MGDNRRGCLAGLLELFVLDKVFDWLQRNFGFGRGCSCSGCGCGIILLILFILFACGIIGGIDWTKFSF